MFLQLLEIINIDILFHIKYITLLISMSKDNTINIRHKKTLQFIKNARFFYNNLKFSSQQKIMYN
jgi:hypothetical protein